MRPVVQLALILSAVTVSISAQAATGSETFTPTYTTTQNATKHFRGFVRSERAQNFLAVANRKSFVSATNVVPGQYSMKGQAGPVEDQGQCGSCWDFSLTSVLRGTWIMEGNDPGRLSFNYLLNCATTEQACNGGDFSAADYFIAPKGAPAYGSDGDYTAGEAGVSGTCQAEPAISSTVDYHMLGNGGAPSFQDIAYVVGVLHRPVSIDVAADDSWDTYKSGVFNNCSNTQIDHMVAIEGYDCETSVDSNGNCVFDSKGNLPPGVGRWIVRNSWGASWGEEGYIEIKATDKTGALCAAVATDALYYDVTQSQVNSQIEALLGKL